MTYDLLDEFGAKIYMAQFYRTEDRVEGSLDTTDCHPKIGNLEHAIHSFRNISDFRIVRWLIDGSKTILTYRWPFRTS